MTSASDEKWRPFNRFFSQVRVRIYQHPCTWWEQLTVSLGHLADTWLPPPTMWSRPMSMVWAVQTGTWQSSAMRSGSWQPAVLALSPNTPTTAIRWTSGWTHLEWWASQRLCMPTCGWMNQVSYFIDRYSFTVCRIHQHINPFENTTEGMFVHLTFIGPCIVIHSYSTTNKMHLFFKLFFLVKHSTCFGQSFCPSAGT